MCRPDDFPPYTTENPRATFHTPYDETREHEGKPIVSLRRLTPAENPDHEDIGDQYEATLGDGTVLVAWPEEVLHGVAVVGGVPW